MKVFTSKEFIDKLYWLTNQIPNVYYNGSQWSKLNSKGQWQFDCVTSVKSILWGFRADPNVLRGGTVYKSNGVKDFTCDGALNYCTCVSQNFNNLVAGEYLCMKGTGYNHTGIYLGNGKVFECTTGWGANRCIISDITRTGTRSLNGVTNLRWTYHGKLNYIDYSNEPTPPTPEPSYTGIITYQAFDGEWLPEVSKADNTDNGYAGIYGKAISGFRCKPQYGELIYQAHIKNGEWLPTVNSKDYSTSSDNSYAGIYNKPIDCIKIKSTKGYVTYRVHVKGGNWLPWVDSRTETGTESYAGIYGKEIDGIQMY